VKGQWAKAYLMPFLFPVLVTSDHGISMKANVVNYRTAITYNPWENGIMSTAFKFHRFVTQYPTKNKKD
jgi:hypothetical protein